MKKHQRTLSEARVSVLLTRTVMRPRRLRLLLSASVVGSSARSCVTSWHGSSASVYTSCKKAQDLSGCAQIC